MTIALAAMKRTFVYKNTSTWPDAPTHEVSRGHIKVIKHFNNTYYLWRFGLPPDCNSYREQISGCCYHTSRHTHTCTQKKKESCFHHLRWHCTDVHLFLYPHHKYSLPTYSNTNHNYQTTLWIPDFCPQNECRALKFNWWHMQALSLQCGCTDTNGCSLFLLHEVVPNLRSVSNCIALHSLHSVHS